MRRLKLKTTIIKINVGKNYSIEKLGLYINRKKVHIYSVTKTSLFKQK